MYKFCFRSEERKKERKANDDQHDEKPQKGREKALW